MHQWLCLLLLFSCSEDNEEEKKSGLPKVSDQDEPSISPSPKKADFPIVYIEELDQYQEFFKEQHETSFSHVKNKNWTSFTAGKDGILTKILLFGKANYLISEHYGSAMSGYVRANNPDKGPKLGEWELSRDEIVNQLASQGLAETEAGWITIRMRGVIPQDKGKTYFLVCDFIDDGRPWFGAFAFSEGNAYSFGRHWLHPDHDLVFRTYVGKTSEQIEAEQKAAENFSPAKPQEAKEIKNSPIIQPPPPKPMKEKDSNLTLPLKPFLDLNTTVPLESNSSISSENEKKTEEKPKNNSLFDKLFKKSK